MDLDLSVLDGLLPSQHYDTRTDDEIVRTLKIHQEPGRSEKNVWAYWKTGYDSMPSWQKRNIINWVRKLDTTSWTVRLLDSVPGSAMNASKFLPRELLPNAFNAGTTSGTHAGVHSADIVRLPLLQLYGGVWMDVGTIMIRNLDDLWSILEDPSTPYELAATTMPLRRKEEIIFNAFIMARRGNPYIERWHKIYLSLWEESTHSSGFHDLPVVRHMRLYEPSDIFNISPEDYTDYLAHMLCGERLRDLNCSDGFNGRHYYETKIFLVSSFQEMFLLQKRAGWSGQKEFDILNARYDGQKTGTGAYEDDWNTYAEGVVLDVIRNSMMIKLSHGPKGGSSTTWLADYWDDSKYDGADCRLGTFALYLRENILRYNQTRPLRAMDAEPIAAKIYKAGLTEPCETT